MATRATDTLRDLAAGWERLFPSAKLSGIVGDTRHAKRGGYHISIEDQVDSDDYSVVRADDKAPPGKWPRDCASAVDMNLSLADMKVCHARLIAVWRNRATDPRAKYINAHNGWNGTGPPGRYDWVTGTVSTASDDHEWHVHLELRRRYVNDPQAARAVLSILRGESPAQYLGENTMVMSDADKVGWATTNRAAALLAGTPATYQVEGEKTKRVEPNRIAESLARIEAQLTALSGRDFTDEQAIAAELAPAILAQLDPARIAAAIPPTIAKQVADELANRLIA
ncbi:hypothetical protein [Micromonospora sp. S-DT3-3-22]|uniref:hypothetical protein n=1 Tax=Micromonospora sp. S-DT3-3-22 TaxID=2755359 RepID=UPI001890A647|nr:hypothetical protein [Micromonospora sp. S-DT3-3-22]